MQAYSNLLVERRGLLLALSSPSGAGKTSIARVLLEDEPKLKVSISYTTRFARPGESDGQDYHFVDTDTFSKMIKAGEFLEHAQVYGHAYGTPRQPVENALQAGSDVLFDIDWQGVQQIAQQYRSDLVTVFVLPPTWSELEKRLRSRAQDREEIIQQRMAKSKSEISHWAEYDYVIINHTLSTAVTQVRSILHSERLKRNRQLGLPAFVKTLDESYCNPHETDS